MGRDKFKEFREFGRKGGKKTLEKYGTNHFSKMKSRWWQKKKKEQEREIRGVPEEV